jgi:hypothetical protein
LVSSAVSSSENPPANASSILPRMGSRPSSAMVSKAVIDNISAAE